MVRLSLSQLKRIIREAASTTAQADGVGNAAIRAFLLDELLVDNDDLTLEDVVQQSEGAGFDSKEVEETIEEMISTGEILDEDGILVLP
jgi:hypothetical protein|tara:strand:+ start:4046 stop:4312 length:267 start_codon:yes stop_codon:yes gene_type:complete